MARTQKKASSRLEVAAFNIFGISKSTIEAKRGRWVKWDKPSPGWFKFNIDGSVRKGIITGGGVARKDNGAIIAGFSKFYGE